MRENKIENLKVKHIINSISANAQELSSEWAKAEGNQKNFIELDKVNYAVAFDISKFNSARTKFYFLNHITEDQEKLKRYNPISHWRRLAVVAIIVLSIFLPLIFKKSDMLSTNFKAKQQIIFPDLDKAILAVQNGKNIALKKVENLLKSS